MHYATVYLAVVMIKGMLIICVQTRCICEQIHLNSVQVVGFLYTNCSHGNWFKLVN